MNTEPKPAPAEPKHLAEKPPEETKRAPEHEPGYEAKQAAEAAKAHKGGDKDDKADHGSKHK